MRKLSLVLLLLLFSVIRAADFEYGMELFEDGFYEEAIREFEQLIAESPTSREAEEALFQIGESWRLQNNFAKAADAYGRLLRAYPDNSEPDRNHYWLAIMYFQMERYEEASVEFRRLIDSYPNSDFSLKALLPYIESYYKSGLYNRVISEGEKLAESYKGEEETAEILLLTARACFASDNKTRGRQILEKLNDEYATSEIIWDVRLLEIELLQKEKGTEAAANKLKKYLQENIPRSKEKAFRRSLARIYMSNEDYEAALNELEILVKKYDFAPDLPEIILDYQQAALLLQKYNKAAESGENYQKIFRESDKAGEFYLSIAKANYYLTNYSQARENLVKVYEIEDTVSDKVRGEGKHLEGMIAAAEGRYREAINLMQESIRYQQEEAAQIYIEIGDIEREKYQNYNAAINYYRQVITNYRDISLQVEASYKTSLCYEAMGDEEEAMQQLKGINTGELIDRKLAEQIEKKREYLELYQLKNYEEGFDKLLTALSEYLDNSSKELLQQRLAEILAYDLKEYERGAALLSENSPEVSYHKALLLLRLAEKYDFEQRVRERDEALLQVNTILYRLQGVLSPERSDELKIKKLLIAEGDNRSVEGLLEEYIENYQNGAARNEFLLILSDIYQESGNLAKLHRVWDMLQLDKRITAADYYKSKLELAESNYAAGKREQAISLYELVRDEISLSQPEAWYHYARTEYELYKTDEALQRLQFLVDNVSGFSSESEALQFLAGALREKQQYEEAIRYAQYIKAEQRDSEYWRLLANDYLALNSLENAKKSLMRIEDKDDETLLLLADLQYRTGDIEMALYSYGILQEKGVQNKEVFLRRGKIYFEKGEYDKAIQQYESYLTLALPTEEDYSTAALQQVISYYNIERRNKAEEVTKKHEDRFSEEELKEIELAEAIYYIDFDSGKAEKLLNRLISKGALMPEQLIKAYFWRGILYLKARNTEKAKADFETVAGSTDQDFANQARFKLALINYSENNFSSALDDYYYVIENDREGSLALQAARNFASVCRTIEEWDKAISAYEIILERWGDSELEGKTIFDIAYCYYRDKDYEKAVEMFQEAIKLLDDGELQAEAQYWIGESYFGMDEYEKAAGELLKVVYSYEMYPQWAASADLRAGECYIKREEIQKAKRIYQRVIKKYGASSNWGQEAQKRLGLME